MKSTAIATLFVGSLLVGSIFGQAPVQVTPGTPAVKPPETPAPAAPAAPVAPDTVVLTVNGQKYTAAEMDKLIGALPPQLQQTVRLQPQMLSQLFLYKRLAADAEKEGLDKRSPYQEALELSKMQVLAQAEITTQQNILVVSSDDQEKYYKEHTAKFQQAKVRVIYVAFNPMPDKPSVDGKKLLSEADARTKIDDLRKQIAGGADFGKLARENSDDATSAAKDGDFGIIKHTSPYPDPVKNAVFALKAGEMSQPIRQPNGFYLIRLDDLSTQPYDEVNAQIAQDIRQEHFTDWLKGLQGQYSVKVENQDYFKPRIGAPQLQQVR